MTRRTLMSALAAAALLGACSGNDAERGAAPAAEDRGADTLLRSVAQERKEKDDFFASDNSPLPPEDRAAFAGLPYYPLSSEWVVRARFVSVADTAEVLLNATKPGDMRPMRLHGRLFFTLANTLCSLAVYAYDAETAARYPDQYFVPFTDATSGVETYPAGRYLDIVMSAAPGDTVAVDFNRAYNPYCAYNDNYSCTLPPAENTLPVAVKAGEKYHEKAGH